MKYKIEICCDSFASAKNAAFSGADRIELCTDLPEGGSTPSPGLIEAARKLDGIKIHVLIRPRGGDFLYDRDEYNIMLRDIEFCKNTGIDGIVTGILMDDGSIDVPRMSDIVKAAKPMSVTFHRAFDICNDPFRSLSDIISCGAERLLTSGQKDKAVTGAPMIAEMIKRASGRIVIMPGSGITDKNIAEIAMSTGAVEFHMTARKALESRMTFRRHGISMGSGEGDEYSTKVADPLMIRRIRSILDDL